MLLFHIQCSVCWCARVVSDVCVASEQRACMAVCWQHASREVGRHLVSYTIGCCDGCCFMRSHATSPRTMSLGLYSAGHVPFVWVRVLAPWSCSSYVRSDWLSSRFTRSISFVYERKSTSKCWCVTDTPLLSLAFFSFITRAGGKRICPITCETYRYFVVTW
jgi:hypothetical protein